MMTMNNDSADDDEDDDDDNVYKDGSCVLSVA